MNGVLINHASLPLKLLALIFLFQSVCRSQRDLLRNRRDPTIMPFHSAETQMFYDTLNSQADGALKD